MAALLNQWGIASDTRLGCYLGHPPKCLAGTVKGHSTLPDGTFVLLASVIGRDGEEIVVHEDKGYGIAEGDLFTLGDPDPRWAEIVPNAKEAALKDIQPLVA